MPNETIRNMRVGGEGAVKANPGGETVRGKEKGKNVVSQIPTGPNNKIKTSAADHKDPAVPGAKVSVSKAISVISFHFHANGLYNICTLKFTQPHTL